MVVSLHAATLGGDPQAGGAPRPVLFGKLPCRGDFVSRGLAAEAAAAWDSWFAQGLEAAHAALAEGFDKAHDTAPAWRFLCGPSALGRTWRAGAFAASKDRAGRRFFFMLALDDLASPWAAAFGLAAAERIVDSLYRSFADDAELDHVLDDVAAAAKDTAAAAPAAARDIFTAATGGLWWTPAGEGIRFEAGALPPPEFLVRALSPAGDGA